MRRRPPVPPVSKVAPLRDGDELRMPLLAHLNELRQRITRAFIGLAIGTACGAFLAAPVLEFLRRPYGEEFITLAPTDSVVAYFRVALMVGAILSIPLITYQLLMFILPGLTRREKRIVLLALPGITLLFLVGVVFTWAVLIPPAIGFFENFQPTLFRPQWTADLYLSFVTALLFWMGVAFETPLVLFVTSFLGFTTARSLLKAWRIAIVGASIAAALITPTIDPVNMLIVMGPLLVLYLISIVLAAVGSRFARPRTADTLTYTQETR
jgi:sec-independent protein translocase protein TatC